LFSLKTDLSNIRFFSKKFSKYRQTITQKLYNPITIIHFEYIIKSRLRQSVSSKIMGLTAAQSIQSLKTGFHSNSFLYKSIIELIFSQFSA